MDYIATQTKLRQIAFRTERDCSEDRGELIRGCEWLELSLDASAVFMIEAGCALRRGDFEYAVSFCTSIVEEHLKWDSSNAWVVHQAMKLCALKALGRPLDDVVNGTMTGRELSDRANVLGAPRIRMQVLGMLSWVFADLRGHLRADVELLSSSVPAEHHSMWLDVLSVNECLRAVQSTEEVPFELTLLELDV